MNYAHLHLLLNHLPVIGTGLGLVLLGAGALCKSDELTKAAMVVFILMALLSIPAYLTGEPAQAAVNSYPGVTKGAIEPHEDAAGVALAGVEVLGVVALAGLVLMRRQRKPQWLMALSLALAIAVSGVMAYTANLGGQIHHPEIAGPSVTSPASE